MSLYPQALQQAGKTTERGPQCTAMYLLEPLQGLIDKADVTGLCFDDDRRAHSAVTACKTRLL